MTSIAPDDDLVMSLVEMALARHPEERQPYLESACAGNQELLTQVRDYVQWEERMSGFLLDPLHPPLLHEHPFEPGELLDGRFRILREVAQGGMGVVYEAIDEKLDRRIAIKSAKSGFRKRLPPEVRTAREISHPNVCKIFEIHTASTQRGEFDFITMEFLDGETLTERLRAAPLPEKEALGIARQLCAGLAAAHRNQVIHGDLKSNNVILSTAADGSTRAVITDFGLARSLDASGPVIQSGPLAGTPDYMAPELWKGEKASVASDVYALGVLLSELFSSPRLAGQPPAAPHKWDRVLTRCLAPDPARRLSVEQVAQALGPSRLRRWFPAAAAAALLAVISALAAYRTAGPPLESLQLALLPIESTTQDTAPLAAALSRDTAGQLARLKGGARARLTVIPFSDVVRDKIANPVQAQSRLGATHVLRASLNREKDAVILRAYLTDTRPSGNTREWKATYAPGQLRYGPSALAGMVTATLRLPPLVTISAAARQDYLAAMVHTHRPEGLDAAIASLEKAISADPGSPLRYAGLAELQFYKSALSSDNAWLQRASEALRQAELRNLDLPEVHLAAGLLKADAGLYEQAVADYRRTIELQPANGDAYRRLGMVYNKNNQIDEALAALETSVQVESNNWHNHQALGGFHFTRANYREATRHFERMVTLAPDYSDAHFVLGMSYRAAGRLAEAESELRYAIRLEDTAKAESSLGFTLMQQERYSEAVACYLRALAIGPKTYLRWQNLGVSYRLAGLGSQAQDAFRRALALAEQDVNRDPRRGRARADFAYLSARTGDSRRALFEVLQALQFSPNDSATRIQAVMTYEALGRREDTLTLLGTSPPEQLAQLNRDPELADLRRDSRFQHLLRSHGVQ